MEGEAGNRERPQVDVVVLGYGDERWLGACLDAVLASADVDVRILLVDNGCPQATVEAGRDPRIMLLSPGHNTGYAGGCVLGAAAGTAPLIAFVNSDAVVEPQALRELAQALEPREVGLVTGCVLLGDGDGVALSPTGVPLVNAAGNPVHWLGYSWAGGWRDPVDRHLARREVASVSGALCAIRREVWDAVGGFDPDYFAYHEDVDLSLRVWCSGRTVRYVPEARCVHHYEFSRHPRKLELLERNRLLTVLTVYQWSTLLRVLPILLLVEVATLGLAVLGGWGRAKLRGWAWLVRHLRVLGRRRARVRAIRAVPDSSWLAFLDNTLTLPDDSPGRPPEPLRLVLARCGRLVLSPGRSTGGAAISRRL